MDNNSENLQLLNEQMFRACTSANMQLLQDALNKGAQVHAQNDQGKTPLMMVSELGNAALVEYLITRKADTLATNKAGESALHFAIKKSEHSVESSPKVIQSDRIDDKITECVQLLIKAGADIEAPDSYGNTPLMCAILNNQLQTVDLLLKNGANYNAINRNAVSDGTQPMYPLIAACQIANPQILSKLLTAGATLGFTRNNSSSPSSDPNTRTTKNNRPFFIKNNVNQVAISQGVISQVAILSLIQHSMIRPNPDANYLDCLNLLLKHGPEGQLNESDFYSKTPLMLCAEAGLSELIKPLLDAGSDIFYTNRYGHDALSLSKDRETFRILETHMKEIQELKEIQEPGNIPRDEYPLRLRIHEIRERNSRLNPLPELTSSTPKAP